MKYIQFKTPGAVAQRNVNNVSGIYGTLADTTFTEAQCPAGLICVKHAKTVNSGMGGSLKNTNDYKFKLAANGTGAIDKGDWTEIFFANSYDVAQVSGNGQTYNLGFETLGNTAPAGERIAFSEFKLGEQYEVGEDSFSTKPASASYIYATISNGYLVASTSAPTTAVGLYFEIVDSYRRSMGGKDYGLCYVVVARLKSAADE